MAVGAEVGVAVELVGVVQLQEQTVVLEVMGVTVVVVFCLMQHDSSSSVGSSRLVEATAALVALVEPEGKAELPSKTEAVGVAVEVMVPVAAQEVV